MSICLLLIGDGRDAYRERTLASLFTALPAFDDFVEIDDREHRLGFAGAIQRGWDRVLQTGCEYVFHREADFTFNDEVPLLKMCGILKRDPRLVQIALLRQPWNEQEKAAGGIMQLHPEDYTEQRHGDAVWTEHRRNFTTNPSIYRAKLCERGWPQESESEGKFGLQLMAEDPEARFAFWGGKNDPPLVEHIGAERKGTGY